MILYTDYLEIDDKFEKRLFGLYELRHAFGFIGHFPFIGHLPFIVTVRKNQVGFFRTVTYKSSRLLSDGYLLSDGWVYLPLF